MRSGSVLAPFANFGFLDGIVVMESIEEVVFRLPFVVDGFMRGIVWILAEVVISLTNILETVVIVLLLVLIGIDRALKNIRWPFWRCHNRNTKQEA